MRNKTRIEAIMLAAAIILVALLLGLFTTSEHVKALGMDALEHGDQIQRHQDVLAGRAGNPWQYRVLAPYLVDVVIKVSESLRIPHPVAVSFIFFRVVQDTLVLLLSYGYYRKLGLSWSHALIGMAVLAWGISYSHYQSDLQFNTFFDIIFYLLAGLCILKGKFIWIIPITFFAALNRETSGLIPFLPLFVAFFVLPKGSFRKVLPISVIAFMLYVAVFVALRLIYGEQELFLPYGHHPGLDLLQYNLFRYQTWRQLIATLSIIPVIALIGYQRWTPHLRVFFWALVPVWLVIHAFGSVMAESRLFLVPQALVFIPAALLYLARQAGSPD